MFLKTTEHKVFIVILTYLNSEVFHKLIFMKLKNSFDNSPKSLAEITLKGKNTFKQIYDLIITKVYPVFEGRSPKDNRAFTIQSIGVSDGTDTVKLSFTPDQYFNENNLKVGEFLHVEGAYITRKPGTVYWNMKIAKYEKGGLKEKIDKVKDLVAVETEPDWSELKPIYDAVDNKTAEPVKIDITKYKENIDPIFNELFLKIGGLLPNVNKESGQSEAVEWFLSNRIITDNIEILRNAGLMSE